MYSDRKHKRHRGFNSIIVNRGSSELPSIDIYGLMIINAPFKVIKIVFKRHRMKSGLLFFALLFLFACGGGGGSSTSTTQNNSFIVSATALSKSGSYGIGSEIEIKIEFKEAIVESQENKIVVVFQNGLELIFSNLTGTSATAFYIVKEGDNTENLKIASISLFGPLADQAGKTTITNIPLIIEGGSLILVDTIAPTITSLTESLKNDFYQIGETIAITMKFSEVITLEGTISIELSNGRNASMSSFTGDQIEFSYIIGAGDDTINLTVTTITLTGSAIDSAKNNLKVELPATNLGATSDIKIDTTAPYITSFYSTSTNGNYGLGSNINISITFNESVTFNGTLNVSLNSGATVAFTTIHGTSASATYTVQAGQSSTKLSVTSFLLEGNLIDVAGKSLLIEMPTTNLDSNHDITVNTSSFSIQSIQSLTAAGAYTIGKNIQIQLNFDEEAILAGTLTLELNSGGSAFVNSFQGKQATATYMVAANQNTNLLKVTGIIVNGSFKNNLNNEFVPTIPASNLDELTPIIIDTITPTIVSITSSSANGTYRKNDEISLSLQLSEPLIITGELSLILSSSGLIGITSNASSSTNLTYQVKSNENTSLLSLTSILLTGAVTDQAGNSLSTVLPATNINTGSLIVIDSTSAYSKPTQNESSRFLTQATFGPNIDEINALTFKTYEQWLTEQMNKTPTYLRPLLGSTIDADLTWAIHVEAWWKVTVLGEDQLRQRVAFALSEILVISDQSGLGDYKNGLANYYDILIRNSFGNYRTLLEDVTLSPMMGLYLSMLANQKPVPAKNIRPDENYAREIMQLFSIGLYELNIDGTNKLDPEGKPIPTYSQSNVESFAHIFTGWTYAGADNFWWPTVRESILPMQVWVKNGLEEYHDFSLRTILNNEILPANTNAKDGLKIALDNIFNHPNVGPFISKQLIQRLITSNPSPEYVARVAKIFNQNSLGVRGDLKEVVEAIYLDKEARILPAANSNFGKLKEPILKLSALWRAFKGTSNSGKNEYRYPEGDLIQGPLKSPTVFNFFQPNYSHPGVIRDKGLVSPEFQIHDESSITTITNRLYSFTKWRVRGHDDLNPDQNAIKDLMFINLDKEKLLAVNSDDLINHLNLLLLNGEMSVFTKGIVKEMIEFTKIVGNETADQLNNKMRERATNAIIMIMNSPDYNIQR